MRQMEEACNLNMAEEFNPSWINVIDEIMTIWFNEYATGFICVGRKPHPFGNEIHTVCCGLTSILRRYHIGVVPAPDEKNHLVDITITR